MNQLEADVAEFVCHDVGFRRALENVDIDARKKLLKVVYRENGASSCPIEKTLADIMMFSGVAAEVRSRILLFFLKLKVTNCNAELKTLCEKERKEKAQAKRFYDKGDYSRAVAIGLQLLRCNPDLQKDPSVVGFVMHCYNKMNDFENILVYAYMQLALEKSVAAANVAARAAYALGKYNDVIDIAFMSEEYLKFGCFYMLTLRAAIALKNYEYIIKLADVAIQDHRSTMADYLAEVALDAAFRIGRYADVIKFGGLIDPEHCSISTLNMLACAARHNGYMNLFSKYRRLYEDRLAQIENRIVEDVDSQS